MKRVTLLLVMLCLSGMAWSQTRVTGKVTDQMNGEELPGVNILVKGTNNGAVTDIDGNYSVNVDANATLVFSFVGYVTEEVPVGNKSVIDVALIPDIQQLSEVVVVGYGQQEKEDVTGSVVEVGSKEFNRGAIVSPDQLIAGKVPGVNISPDNGEPGGKVQIRIRGGTSITAGNEPLYVVDGIPLENTTQNGGRNPLNIINPDDIETFTVLKDASAAAIYGSRAANGVILITTKSGKFGARPGLTYNSWVSFSSPTDKMDVLDGDQYRALAAEIAPEELENLLNANTDWQAQVLQTGFGQNHSLAFNGGSENTAFRIGLNYLDKEGIIRESSTQRTSMNLSLTQKLLDEDMTIKMNFKGAYTEDSFTDGAVISNALGFAPTQPIYDVNSPFGGYWEWPTIYGTAVSLNPVAQLEQLSLEGETYRSIGNIETTYNLPFVAGLSAKLNLGYDILKGERRDFKTSELRNQLTSNGEAKVESITRSNKLLEAYLNYEKSLTGISSNLKAIAGYSYQDFYNGFPTITARDLTTGVYTVYRPNVGNETDLFFSVQENRLISFFGRVDYDYKNRYLLTVNMRYDGSSRFGPDNRWGFFPSASLGWRIIDEPWMQGTTDIFSDLKIRAGWGVTGNQEFGNYNFLALYFPGDQFTQYLFGGQPVLTTRPSAYDPALKWEETTQYNVGVDFGVLNGRLNGTLDFYLKDTEDLLFETAVPAGTNLSNFVVTNIGSMENKGIELGLNGVILDRQDLRWNVGFNVAYNKNTITKLNGNTDPDFLGIQTGDISGGVGNKAQIHSVGQTRNTFFLYEHIFDEEGNPRRDNIDYNDDGLTNELDMYVDQNGDGVINTNDLVYGENPLPDFLYGLTSNVNYKDFDLSFTLRASTGNYVYNNFASFAGNYSRLTTDITPGNMHASVLDNRFNEPQILSDIYVEDASFLRMDNITLGYNVPGMGENRSLRVYGTIQNAFVITGYSGLDPEAGVDGLDRDLYPRARTFQVGLNLGL